MNIEDSGINPNILNVQKTFEDNFSLLPNIHFIKEVFEEVIPNNQRNNLDDSKIGQIVARCFEIMKSERIETFIDSEAQKPIMIRVAFEETESGYLANDSVFKINGVRNIAEIKEKQNLNTNNGCIKFVLTNGKEEVSAVEEGKLTDIPQELKLVEGSLLYVTKDTSIRRNIILLTSLNCFIFQSMQQFRQGMNQLTQRIEKHARDMENREKEQERKKREREAKEKERVKERERVIAQRTAAQSVAATQMTEESRMRNFNENSNIQIMEARQNAVRAESNQFQSNQWFDPEEEEFINQNLDNQNYNAVQNNYETQNNNYEAHNNNNNNNNNNDNNGGQQQMTAEECNELLSILYDDD